MKQFLAITCLFFVCTIGAQSMTFSPLNLVPNPSFEDSVSCPTYISQLNRTEFWYNPTSNTPDYYNECFDSAVSQSADVPTNWYGTQAPHFGKAYAGAIALYGSANGREYISVKLKDTLIVGHPYCLEFFVSLSDSSFVGVNYFGAHLSATPDTMYCQPCPLNFYSNLPFQPQIEFDSIISDTAGWTKISGSFIANGNECYLTLGVFKPDSLLSVDTIRGDGTNNQSYYYIDDVAVWDCDTPDVIYPQILFYPNPSDGNFNIVGNFPAATELKIYNMLGQQVCRTIPLPEGNNEIPIYSFLAQGIYVCRVESNGDLLKSQMICITR